MPPRQDPPGRTPRSTRPAHAGSRTISRERRTGRSATGTRPGPRLDTPMPGGAAGHTSAAHPGGTLGLRPSRVWRWLLRTTPVCTA
ncbi:hypothetical protein FAGKG844_70005 [Frankia sp. AgKG'84/4]